MTLEAYLSEICSRRGPHTADARLVLTVVAHRSCMTSCLLSLQCLVEATALPLLRVQRAIWRLKDAGWIEQVWSVREGSRITPKLPGFRPARRAA